MQNPNNAEALAHGARLQDALDHAHRTGDVTGLVEAADRVLARGVVAMPRGELLATYLYRAEIALLLEGRSGRYHGVATALVDAGHCTVADMREALLGTLLTVGQRRGFLEAPFYDLLADAVERSTGQTEEWRLAMSLIERVDVPGTPTQARVQGKRRAAKRKPSKRRRR